MFEDLDNDPKRVSPANRARDWDLLAAWAFRVVTVSFLSLVAYVGKGALDKLEALPEIKATVAVLAKGMEGQKDLVDLAVKNLNERVSNISDRVDRLTRR